MSVFTDLFLFYFSPTVGVSLLWVLVLSFALFFCRLLVWWGQQQRVKARLLADGKKFKTSHLKFVAGVISLVTFNSLALFLEVWPWGFVGQVGIFLGYKIFTVYQKKQQAARLKKQLPLFLRALGSTLKAGYSVPQGLLFVAEEVENPLKEKLSTGVNLLRWQQPLEKVLHRWKKALPVPEFAFLSDCLLLQSRQGGDIIELCQTMAHLLEERERLNLDLKSFAAQGKFSGLLMAALWPISLLLFSWISPSHTQVLFYQPAGQILLALSLVLEMIGFWCIWRLIRVKI